jgi:hypothetical protein
MIPLFEPAAPYASIAVGLAWLGAAAVVGTVVVVGLVAKVLPRRLPKAA